jgi:hypothetical protein
VFDNRVLRIIFGPKREEVVETREDCMVMVISFITCVLHQILLG